MATATYVPIATQTLSSAASSITFSSIPSTYTDLRLVVTGATTASQNVRLQFNGDTATNYSDTYLVGNGSSASSGSDVTNGWIYLEPNGFTTTPSTLQADIFSYAGSTYKTVLSAASEDANGSGSVSRTVGLWRSTAAITSIKLLATNFATGFTATLWGI